MPTEDFISCDFPDLDAFIKELDLMDERVNAALRRGLNAGADIIRDEQRRIILNKPPAPVKDGKTSRRISKGSLAKLAQAISKGSIYTTRSGGLGISTGYQNDAFRTDADGFNAGVVGMTYEFGRPGESTNRRRSETMTQTRHGRRFKVRKGAIQPVSHIRAGFDAAVNRAANEVIAEYEREMDKL